jgi:hypothetical protein
MSSFFSIADADRGPPVQREPLKHRDYEVDLESRLGKTQVCHIIFPCSLMLYNLFHAFVVP